MQVKGEVLLTTPRIDELLSQFRQRIASEAITDPVAQPDCQSVQPVCSTVADPADPVNEERIRKLEHQVSQLIQKVPIYHCCQPFSHLLRHICVRFGVSEITQRGYILEEINSI